MLQSLDVSQRLGRHHQDVLRVLHLGLYHVANLKFAD